MACDLSDLCLKSVNRFSIEISVVHFKELSSLRTKNKKK